MNNTDYTEVLNQLRTIQNNLSTESALSTEDIFRNVALLEGCLMTHSFTQEQQQEVIDLFTEYLHQYQQHFTDYTAALEKEFTEHTISTGEIDFEFLKKSIWYYRFDDLIKEEVRLSGMNTESNPLFIGSGPFPLTAILYHIHAGCQVTCIEKEAEYAETSKQLLAALGMHDTITVLTGLGEEFVDNAYTHVTIGLQALPKNLIFKQVQKQIPSGIKIICRTKSGFGDIFYSGESETTLVDAHFDVLTRVQDRDMTIVPIISQTK